MYIPIVTEKLYPVKVIIFEKRAGGYMPYFDRAKRKKDKSGTDEYYLRKRKVSIRPAEYGKLMENKKGIYMLLYAPSAREYRQLEVNDKGVTVLDEDMAHFYARSLEDTYKRFEAKKGMWEKWIPMLSIIFVAVAICIILFGLGTYMSSVVAQISGAAAMMRDATNTLAGAIQGLG